MTKILRCAQHDNRIVPLTCYHGTTYANTEEAHANQWIKLLEIVTDPGYIWANENIDFILSENGSNYNFSILIHLNISLAGHITDYVSKQFSGTFLTTSVKINPYNIKLIEIPYDGSSESRTFEVWMKPEKQYFVPYIKILNRISEKCTARLTNDSVYQDNLPAYNAIDFLQMANDNSFAQACVNGGISLADGDDVKLTNLTDIISSGLFTVDTTNSWICIPKGCHHIETYGRIAGWGNMWIGLTLKEKDNLSNWNLTGVKPGFDPSSTLIQKSGNGYHCTALSNQIVEVNPEKEYVIWLEGSGYNETASMNDGFSINATFFGVRKID